MSLWDAAMSGRSLDELVFAAYAANPPKTDYKRRPKHSPLRNTGYPEAKRAERRAKNKAARKARRNK